MIKFMKQSTYNDLQIKLSNLSKALEDANDNYEGVANNIDELTKEYKILEDKLKVKEAELERLQLFISSMKVKASDLFNVLFEK